VVGQDGKHFNRALTDSPTNTTVPANVLNALYNNSDHLPVNLKLVVTGLVGIPQYAQSAFAHIEFTNPVRGNQLMMHLKVYRDTRVKIEFYSLLGKRLSQSISHLQRGDNQLDMDISGLPRGMYVVRFTDAHGLSQSRKLFKR
jgi:hypothetical protein